MPIDNVASNKITLTGTAIDNSGTYITTSTFPYTETLVWDTNNNYWDTTINGNWTKKNTFVINTLKEDPFAQCETEEEIEYVEHKIKEQIYKMRDNALQRIKENA